MAPGLKIYRCRARVGEATIALECVAPSAEAAAYVAVREDLQAGNVPWVQVTASEWSGALGEYIEPEAVMIFLRGAPPPEGAAEVVVTSHYRSFLAGARRIER